MALKFPANAADSNSHSVAHGLTVLGVEEAISVAVPVSYTHLTLPTKA